MFWSSSSLVKQASQRAAVRLAPSSLPSRLLSTSTTRLADHADGSEETKASRMQRLLLEIPPEYNIPDMNQKESQASSRQNTKPQSRPSGKAWRPIRDHRSSAPTSDTYSMLQTMRLPQQNRAPRSQASSKKQNEDGKERKSTENAQRPERGAHGGARSDRGRENRQPGQNSREGGVRAETSRGPPKERSSRPHARESMSTRPPAPSRQPKPEPVPRAAPTVEELFGESSMLGGQSSVGNEVFESLQSTEETLDSKSVPKASDLDLLPPSPIVPHFLAPSAPRKRIHEFAVLQADYVLSRNSNVSLDQRGQAIGLVKQRLGA